MQKNQPSGWNLILAVAVVLALCVAFGDFSRAREQAFSPIAQSDEILRGEDGVVIDINRASVAMLQSLPGLGETLARRIVEYRTEHGAFRATDDLRNVPGIGEKTLERIRPYIGVGDAY